MSKKHKCRIACTVRSHVHDTYILPEVIHIHTGTAATSVTPQASPSGGNICIQTVSFIEGVSFLGSGSLG